MQIDNQEYYYCQNGCGILRRDSFGWVHFGRLRFCSEKCLKQFKVRIDYKEPKDETRTVAIDQVLEKIVQAIKTLGISKNCKVGYFETDEGIKVEVLIKSLVRNL